MKKNALIGSLFTIILAITLLILYLFDGISGFIYIGGLIVIFFFLMISLILLRNSKPTRLYLSGASGLIALLLIFDFAIINYELFTHTVTSYAEPIETTANIHLMVVDTTATVYLGSADAIISESEDVLEVYPIRNVNRYVQKNVDLRARIFRQPDHFDRMRENVEDYLGFAPGDVVPAYDRTDIDGDSLGLGIALAAELTSRGFENHVPIAATGAIQPDGRVDPIGAVAEKTLIAAQNDLPYLLVPVGNAEAANEIADERELAIEIIDIAHIEEAIAFVKSINE